MFDHLSLKVSDFDVSLAFYTAALDPLGYSATEMNDNGSRAAGFGRGKVLQFWISEDTNASTDLHFAFSADDHKAVDSFYENALSAGGLDNGPPGIRNQYHVSYYAAFVIDPDGNNIEVVCHFPGKLEDQFAAD